MHHLTRLQVWPSIWTKGNNWPDNGEIDIIEGVNRMTYNQMALHTQEGCTAATGVTQTGQAGSSNCTEGAGCTVVCHVTPQGSRTVT